MSCLEVFFIDLAAHLSLSTEKDVEDWVSEDVSATRPLLRVELQDFVNEVLELFRKALLKLNLSCHQFTLDFLERVIFEGRIEVAHFVEEHSQRPDIHFFTLLRPEIDLWSHVLESPTESRMNLRKLSNRAEVSQLGLALSVDEDVFWLDVAMDHLVLMQKPEALHYFIEQSEKLGVAEFSEVFEEFEQVSLLCVFEQNEESAILDFVIKKPDDVLVAQLLMHFDFPQLASEVLNRHHLQHELFFGRDFLHSVDLVHSVSLILFEKLVFSDVDRHR